MSRDRIELRGLRVLGICGVLEEERQRPQPLELDLDLDTDLALAARTDDLTDTVDYGAVCSAVERVVSTGRFTLLERLAEAVADVALADDRVEAVEVAVRKLRPPVAQHLTSTGVRITRRRPVGR